MRSAPAEQTMPTYVYECNRCTNVFEVEQPITADPVRDCACGATDSVKRLIQPVGIAFKGAGFHVNDYSAPSEPAPAPAPPPPSGDSSE